MRRSLSGSHLDPNPKLADPKLMRNKRDDRAVAQQVGRHRQFDIRSTRTRLIIQVLGSRNRALSEPERRVDDRQHTGFVICGEKTTVSCDGDVASFHTVRATIRGLRSPSKPRSHRGKVRMINSRYICSIR